MVISVVGARHMFSHIDQSLEIGENLSTPKTLKRFICSAAVRKEPR
jgi:hypothetical protein